jgi:hypothetical protein
MGFARFMASGAGRTLRIVAGLALIVVGAWLAFAASSVVLGAILAVVGLVPFFAGVFDFCVFAPLFGAPLSGTKIRAHQGSGVLQMK